MKPPKKILLATSDEGRLSLRSFVLTTHHYDVFSALTTDEVRYVVATLDIDLLLIEMPFVGLTERTLGDLRVIQPTLKMLVLTGSESRENLWDADAVLPKMQSSAAEVLDRVKILVGRKRGPRSKQVAQLLADRRCGVAA